MKNIIEAHINQAISKLVESGHIRIADSPGIKIDCPKISTNGDWAVNHALVLAKKNAMAPMELGKLLVSELEGVDLFKKIELVAPGFINLFLSDNAVSNGFREVFEKKNKYGSSNLGQGVKTQVEYVSANPTGPLHVGHARSAAIGDSVYRLLAFCGWRVSSEYYYNDAGNQIENLAKSVVARIEGFSPGSPQWPTAGYQGEYIQDIADRYIEKYPASENKTLDFIGIKSFAVDFLRAEQDKDLSAFGVKFDNYFLESSLFAKDEVDSVVGMLANNEKVYDEEGALWLKTTEFGDDKNRVIIKRDGTYTYFISDVAYHLDKWNRGFVKVVNEQGADHQSTVTRVRAGLQALDIGIPKGWPDYILHQMIRVVKNGKEVKLGKRAGSYLTLSELVDMAGKDATRYFLVSKSAGTQMVFDVDLALLESKENPVYYVQYAYARVCAVKRKCCEQGGNIEVKLGLGGLSLLQNNCEAEVKRQILYFPGVVDSAARAMEPHQIANYLYNLAKCFHAFYDNENCKVLVEDEKLRAARSVLCAAVGQVLENGLGLLGITAPEKM